MNASKTLISVSLLSRRSCIVTSQAIRKTPTGDSSQSEETRHWLLLTFYASDAEAVDDILRQSEGNTFWCLELFSLLNVL